MVLGSGPAVQGIVLGPGDRLFDEAKVKVKQLLGLRAGDDRGFAIDRRHCYLCGQKGPGSIGGDSVVVIGLAPVDGFRDRFQLARGPSTARVLRSPFRAGAAHVVQLGPVRVEQRGPQPAPPPHDHVQTTPLRRGRKQHSRDIRI